MTIENQLAALREQEKQLLNQLDEKRSRMRFKCGCGSTHTIRQCVLIQSHWYERPHGCMGGDRWHTGEMAIICPDTGLKNRLFFDSEYKVSWDVRNDYEYSAEMQFARLYKHLFKEVFDDYGDDRRDFWNNNYFDENRKRFGLHVKGLDE